MSKLLWNPFISDLEYERLIHEFGLAYYGAGYSFLLEYIRLWENTIKKNLHFNYDLTNLDENGPAFDLMKKEDISTFIQKAELLWSNCEKCANQEQLERIRKDRLQFDYLELLLTFDDVMQNGSAEEQKMVLSKNRKLIDAIKKYNIKITFWGQTVQSQNEEMDKFYTTSPRRWNYKW